MDDEEILQLVVDCELDPEQVADFKELSEELQELVADGSIDADDAIDLGL